MATGFGWEKTKMMLFPNYLLLIVQYYLE